MEPVSNTKLFIWIMVAIISACMVCICAFHDGDAYMFASYAFLVPYVWAFSHLLAVQKQDE